MAGIKPSSVFKKCARITVVLSLALTIVGIYSTTIFTSHDEDDF